MSNPSYTNNNRPTNSNPLRYTSSNSVYSSTKKNQPEQSVAKKIPSFLFAIFIAFTVNPILGVIGIIAATAWLVNSFAFKTTDHKKEDNPFSQSDEDHLCEDNQHTYEDKGGKEALSNMQEGYSTFNNNAPTAHSRQFDYASKQVNVYKYQKKLTREELNKKLDNMRSLREAGIITNEEYEYKRREYTKFTIN